jgi:hypothetical protein
MMSDWGTHTRPGLGEKMHSRCQRVNRMTILFRGQNHFSTCNVFLLLHYYIMHIVYSSTPLSTYCY